MIICEKTFDKTKNFESQLKLIYGISKTRAKIICSLLGLNKNFKLNNLNYLILDKIDVAIEYIINKEKQYKIESKLKYNNLINLRELRLLNSYKSVRHAQFLPVNGQRTKTNAKTQKKKR